MACTYLYHIINENETTNRKYVNQIRSFEFFFFYFFASQPSACDSNGNSRQAAVWRLCRRSVESSKSRTYTSKRHTRTGRLWIIESSSSQQNFMNKHVFYVRRTAYGQVETIRCRYDGTAETRDEKKKKKKKIRRRINLL